MISSQPQSKPEAHPAWNIPFFPASLLAAALAFSGCEGTFPSASFSTSAPQWFSQYSLLLLALVFSLFLAAGLAWRLRRTAPDEVKTSSPDHLQNLVKQDCAALSIAMTELAQGDLTARLSIGAETLDPAAYPQMRAYAGLFNSVVASLQDTAREFSAVTATPCHRLCYIGADSFLEGRACAEATAKAVHREGTVGVVAVRATGPELRRKGFLSLLHEKYPRIKVATAVQVSEDDEAFYSSTASLLRDHPDLRAVYITTGSAPHAAVRAAVDAGRINLVGIFGHDLVDETMREVRRGRITATLGQDAFAQGYEPVVLLFNHLVAGWEPPVPRLLTHLDLITKNNWHQFWDPDRGIVESETMAARRTHPVPEMPSRPLRIAVLGREDSKFFQAVKAGVLAAQEKLRPLRTTVEWIVPRENREGGDISSDVYGRLLEELATKGYDGLATGVYDQDYVPYINRAVARGVPVITFNSEPTNLRSLVLAIAAQARRLMGMSENLSDIIGEINHATTEINSAMGQVSRGTLSQNKEVEQTHQSLEALLKRINEVSARANQGATAAQTAAQAASTGTEVVGRTVNGIQAIRRSVTNTAETVDKLGEHSEQIDLIIKMIDNIAYQIKLLGINAVIEAANAGEHGAGFLVVAGEIRSLAERTAQATQEITELLDSVRLRIDEVQKATEEGLEKVTQGTKLAEEAGAVLGKIRENVEGNQQNLSTIASAMSEIQSISQRVGETLKGLASVSRENTAAVEEVSASTRQMSARLEEAATWARALAEMSQAEEELLAQFNLSDREETVLTERRSLRDSDS